MDILEFAMQMELDGIAFYKKGADNTDSAELKKILVTLAEEEQKHYKIFKSMKEGDLAAAESAMGPGSDTPALAKNIFKQMAEAGTLALPGDEVVAMWQEALRVEEKSEKMYREAADAEGDTTRKDLLNRIADEEKNHIYLIDNMISFSRNPQAFLASTQYKNFQSWEGH